MTKLFVAGSRVSGERYREQVYLALSQAWALWSLSPDREGFVVVHPGADSGAASYAQNWVASRSAADHVGVLIGNHLADSDRMLVFWDGRTPGEAELIQQATRAGRPVLIVPVGSEYSTAPEQTTLNV